MHLTQDPEVQRGSCRKWRRDKALDFEPAFAFHRGEVQEVQDELAQDGEVPSGMIGTSAHPVIGKEHVHAPVQTVLDAPMLANGFDAFLQRRAPGG